MKQLKRFKIISFDLDETLLRRDFVDAVWFREIPLAYAKKNKLPFKQALRECRAAYDSVGNSRLEWYSFDYWLKRFGLQREKKRILRDLKHLITCYPEAKSVLRSLRKKGFRIIIVSNSSFLSLKLKASGLDSFVDAAFSSTEHFRTVRKSKRVFQRVCKRLGAKPSAVVHVGDFRVFDYEMPRAAGATAFLLNRHGEHKPCNKKERFFIVRNLKEFEKRVLELSELNCS